MNKVIIVTNRLQNIIKQLGKGSHLEICNEHFSNEIIFYQSLQSSILGDITFFNVDFRNVDFIGSHLLVCNFKNCTFNNVLFIKCEFWGSTFENCQIENCNLVRACFHEGNFKDCNFIKVDLTATTFSNLEFSETKFINSKLDLIGVRSIKLSNSKQSLEIEKSSKLEFKKILTDMNLIISTDEDHLNNS